MASSKDLANSAPDTPPPSEGRKAELASAERIVAARPVAASEVLGGANLDEMFDAWNDTGVKTSHTAAAEKEALSRLQEGRMSGGFASKAALRSADKGFPTRDGQGDATGDATLFVRTENEKDVHTVQLVIRANNDASEARLAAAYPRKTVDGAHIVPLEFPQFSGGKAIAWPDGSALTEPVEKPDIKKLLGNEDPIRETLAGLKAGGFDFSEPGVLHGEQAHDVDHTVSTIARHLAEVGMETDLAKAAMRTTRIAADEMAHGGRNASLDKRHTFTARVSSGQVHFLEEAENSHEPPQVISRLRLDAKTKSTEIKSAITEAISRTGHEYGSNVPDKIAFALRKFVQEEAEKALRGKGV